MAPKIAVNGSFLLKPKTGVQRYAFEMISGLKKIGFNEVVILAPQNYLDESLDGYPVIRDKAHFGRNLWLWEQIRLPIVMKKFKEYTLWSPSNIGPLFVENQILTIHDASVFAGKEWFSKSGLFYYRWMLPRVAKKSKHILTVSNFSKQELIKYGIADETKISVVPCAVSEQFLLQKNTTTQTDIRHSNIIAIGSRDPRKNFGNLIKAWGLMGESFRANRKLLVIGGYNRGFSSENIDEIPGDVEFLGYRTDEELISFLKQSRFLVFPSLYEGFGLPPLEAMALGVPTIVSNCSSLPEVCGEASLYCNPHDVNDISEKMKRLLTDDELHKSLSRRSIQQASKFSWENSAMQLIKVLNKNKE